MAYKRHRQRKHIIHHPMEDVYLPTPSYGVCINVRNCRSYRPAWLGDGYCVRCHERGDTRLKNTVIQRQSDNAEM